MSGLTLTGLTVYPIKSAGGISVSSCEVDEFGLRHDRRWMVVDPLGNFLTQRTHPRLALVRPSVVNGILRIEAPEMRALELPLKPTCAGRREVTIWRDRCDALWLGADPADWFSSLLGCHCELVYMPDDSRRPVDPGYALTASRVSFADGFPFLLLSEESLADLNARLAAPLPINRFRPNLVIAGGAAFVEDGIGLFRIGKIRFRVMKPCGRCVITTTDQETGERSSEPLRTLATYRRLGGEVVFGQNVVHDGSGRLSVGDAVLV